MARRRPGKRERAAAGERGMTLLAAQLRLVGEAALAAGASMDETARSIRASAISLRDEMARLQRRVEAVGIRPKKNSG